MKAIMVSVDYGDILNLTLPRNKHHFDEVMVVTSSKDKETQRIANKNKVNLFVTDSFYSDGAIFNKWRAMEEGLDAFGREGWLSIMDADVIWPQKVNKRLKKGNIYSPGRCILKDIHIPLPKENVWQSLPRHIYDEYSFAGYTFIFHADDSYLPEPPWHEIDWSHAGGADTLLQQRWPQSHKIRLHWSVLHLGPPCKNWCGRATDRLDGKYNPDSTDRFWKLQEFMKLRRIQRSRGKDKYAHERIRIHG